LAEGLSFQGADGVEPNGILSILKLDEIQVKLILPAGGHTDIYGHSRLAGRAKAL
jgi:hypothetical protein